MVVKISSKHASIQISMSWIFMIIIGSFFFILAYNVIGKYQQIEKQKQEFEFQNSFRAILNNVGRTAGIEESSVQPIGNIFKDSQIEIKCSDYQNTISINGQRYANNQFIKNYPIFMTYIKQQKVDSTYIAVENFRMPFKITNMLAIVSKKNLIVFDSNSVISKKMLEKFKKYGAYKELNFMDKDFTTLDNSFVTETMNHNYNSIIFVSDYNVPLGSSPITLSQFPIRAYKLEIDVTSDNYGQINYTDKNNNNYIFNYIDYNQKLSLPTMAVFSAPQTFNCSYNLLINSIEPIYDYYLNKSKILENISSSKQICSKSIPVRYQSSFYSSISTDLGSVLSEIKTNKFENPSNIVADINRVEDSHKGIEKNSCLYLY